jgi:hypothetical protein
MKNLQKEEFIYILLYVEDKYDVSNNYNTIEEIIMLWAMLPDDTNRQLTNNKK